MASWSERELEDWLWEHPEELYPFSGFHWIGRQVTLAEGRLDLLGMMETEAGRAFYVVELKAGRADGRALTQLQNYMSALSMQLVSLPERAKCALADSPVYGMLVAPEFTRRIVVAASYFSDPPKLFLKRVEAFDSIWTYGDDAEYKLWEMEAPQEVVNALTAPAWTPAQVRATRCMCSSVE